MRCFTIPILAVVTAVCAPAVDFTTGQAARAEIGQITFTEQTYGASDTLLGAISGLAYANNTLFVADSNRVGALPINNRVLIFNNIHGIVPSPTAELLYDRKCPVCVGQANLVLGQADFTATDYSLSKTGLRLPTAVASNGQILAIADTDNNRILIWNSIPTSSNTPADVVLGQPDFTHGGLAIPGDNTPTAWSMRGPQGVWIDKQGRLYVADTQNHRVLIWRSIPTQNKAPADVVLGQPNFETAPEPDLTQAKVEAKATNLLNPVSVTTDDTRLFVTDLGHNRVLVWNTIPDKNEAPADFALGQPDVQSTTDISAATSNNVQYLCASEGTDETTGDPLYPPRCNATLSWPRFALSDGNRVFVADGGNDRVLIWNHMPTSNGQPADVVLGQIDPRINIATEATDSLRTPMSLAWDGTNLYVSDAYNRRVMIYSVGENTLPYTAVRNAASREIFAVGSVTLSGSVTDGNEVSVKINDTEYKYKATKDDDFSSIITQLVDKINAGSGDPNVLATPNLILDSIILTARMPGSDGNAVTLTSTVTPTDTATILATASGANLAGGMDAAQIAPGTLVSLIGDNLSDETQLADQSKSEWPTDLGGVQVYFNGVRAPLQYVSPTQVNAQVPFEFLDVTSINAYIRTQRHDGSVTVTTPVAVSIVPQNPGIFAGNGSDPRPAVALHLSSNATGTILVAGSTTAGDVASVTIGEGDQQRTYSYTVVEGDTLATVRDALINQINQDPEVIAYAAGQFTYIRLRARTPGVQGNGIKYSATSTPTDTAAIVLAATGSALCCASEAGSLVTEDNPALPGETIVVYATGIGLVTDLTGVNTGQKYEGAGGEPNEFVSSLAGGKTANVLFAGLKAGMIGVYEVQLELNTDLPTNPQTQVTIAQSFYVSNIVTLPVYNPNPSTTTTP